MEIKPKKLLYFNKMRHINNDDYGTFTINHAIEWAELMEDDIKSDQISEWEDIVDYMINNAERVSFKTKTCYEGLTGFQHDCASVLLISTWKYGFELWLGLLVDKHNKGFKVHDENVQWVLSYLDGDYEALLEYKEEIKQ